MRMHPVYFDPNGDDLRKVLYYYGIVDEEKIICPFHDDNNPSCHINYDEGVFYCFACGAGGNALDFVKLANPKANGLYQLILYNSILNSDEVRRLKVKGKRKVSKRKQQEALKSDLEYAHDYYHGLKAVDWNELEENVYKDYLTHRGYSPDILNEMQVKLTITNDNYPIIIPIFDNDVFRGYVCRTTNKAIEKQRKYLYNKGFSRNDTLGGHYRSKVVVLVEGYLDMVKMKQFGLKYVAAIFGWKITSQQIVMLKAAGVETIISALDMDEPGRKGTTVLKKHFDVVEFQFPEQAKDPGDLTYLQFKIAYDKTKRIYRSRRKRKHVNSK